MTIRDIAVFLIAMLTALSCAHHETDASRYTGKVVLVGVSLVDANGSGSREFEIHGVIKGIDSEVGIIVAVPGVADEFYLPPVLDSLRPVEPGAYREHNTGVVVDHADYATVWEAQLDRGVAADAVDWRRSMTWKRPVAFTFPGEHWDRE